MRMMTDHLFGLQSLALLQIFSVVGLNEAACTAVKEWSQSSPV